VSRSKNNLNGLISQLSRGKQGSKAGTSLLLPSSPSSPKVSSKAAKLSPGSDSNVRSRSLTAKSLNPIQFGKPSHSSASSSSSSSSDLNKLLKSTTGSALSSLTGGGSLLGGLFGLGSVGSLFGSLFGGSGTAKLPPLTTFALPQAQAEMISIGGGANSMDGPTSRPPTSGTYATPTAQVVAVPSSAPVNQTYIAQAVKLALLNSSSLNDVINEV
jgi:hypothetical protein